MNRPATRPLRLHLLEDRCTPAMVFALDPAGTSLMRFDSASPGTVLNTTAVTGLSAGGESLMALDFRPATGQLYALGVTPGASGDLGRLYTVDTATGQAAAVGGTFALTTATGYGFDFNPAADRIRLTTDADQNLRINPADGSVTADTALAYATTDANAGGNPAVVAAGYSNNTAGTTTTTLYGLDFQRDILVTQNPPNAGTLNTVGPLGSDTTAVAGLDIGANGVAYALLTGPAATAAQFATVNLATGAATLVGAVGGGLVRDLAVAQPGTVAFSAATYAATEGSLATITLVRTGGTSGTSTVQVTATGGTAVSGADYIGLPALVTFGPGETTKQVTLPLIENTAVNAPRTVNLSVGSPAGGATVGGQTTAVLTIQDNDSVPDTTAPTVTVEQAASQVDPATTQPVLFTVTFSESVTGFDATDVLLSGTAATGATAAVSGTGAVYTVAVSGLTRAGTVRADVRVGAATDAAGNPSTASTSTDNQIVFAFGPGVGLDRPAARQFAVGAGAGGLAEAAVYGPTGTELYRVTPYTGFTGGVRVALGDFNSDGTPDLIAGTGPGRTTSVRVLDGKTRSDLVLPVTPFETSFTGGVYVAAGDVSGDGVDDLIVTPDQGGGPVVAIYDGASLGAGKLVELTRFFGIEDKDFRGGARAAIGDLNRDSIGDLVVAAGFGGGPRVALFDGATVTQPTAVGKLPPKLMPDFFVFEPSLRNGVFIAAADLDGDGAADVIAGGGPGGGPRVFGLSGADLVGSSGKTLTQVANFFAGDPNGRSGVRLTGKNLDGDAKADLVTGSGSDTTLDVTVYLGSGIQPNNTPTAASSIDPFDVSGGVYVG